MASFAFDPHAYYRLLNDVAGQDATLSDGGNQIEPQDLIVSTTSYSSENWQIFKQSGVWFIRVSRNYDFGADYQLGLDGSSVKLMKSAADLNQQWLLTQDGNNFKLGNMKADKDAFLSVSKDAKLQITSNDDGSLWEIDINESAGEVSDDMRDLWPSIEKESSTQTSTTSSTSTSSLSATNHQSTESAPEPTTQVQSLTSGTSVFILTSTATQHTQAAASTTSALNSSPSETAPAGTVSPQKTGTIAGAAIGGIAALGLVVALMLLFARKLRKARQLHHAATARDTSTFLGEASQAAATTRRRQTATVFGAQAATESRDDGLEKSGFAVQETTDFAAAGYYYRYPEAARGFDGRSSRTPAGSFYELGAANDPRSNYHELS